MNRTLLGATLAAGSALALVAGCGGNAATPSSAGASTSDTGASVAASSGGASASSAPAPVALQAALADSSSDKTVTFTGSYTTSLGTGQISGQEQFAPQFAMSMNLSSSKAIAGEIWIGSTIYLKDPALTAAVGGKTWVSFDLKSMGTLGSTMSAETDMVKDMNPANQIASMLASDNLADLGPQTVDGVQTTHYSGTVDPATAYDSPLAKKYLTPAQIQQLRSVDSESGPSTEKIDLWLASDGLPVKIVIVDTTSAGSTTSTMQFTGWGQPVDISAPPAAEVGTMPTG